MKDNELREFVNELTQIALTFNAHDSLRERIAEVVVPKIKLLNSEIELLKVASDSAYDRFSNYMRDN